MGANEVGGVGGLVDVDGVGIRGLVDRVVIGVG